MELTADLTKEEADKKYKEWCENTYQKDYLNKVIENMTYPGSFALDPENKRIKDLTKSEKEEITEFFLNIYDKSVKILQEDGTEDICVVFSPKFEIPVKK